jgi:two-component SAPR family response regulator
MVARRPFLPEAEAPWAETWRRRLADVRIRALESYAKTCLELGGAELPGAERAARELVEVARRDNHAGECFHYDNNNNKQSKQYPVLYR